MGWSAANNGFGGAVVVVVGATVMVGATDVGLDTQVTAGLRFAETVVGAERSSGLRVVVAVIAGGTNGMTDDVWKAGGSVMLERASGIPRTRSIARPG